MTSNGVENAPHYPKVVRFTSTDGGLTATTQTIILNMTGETQGQSHQISNLTFGPDGETRIYVVEDEHGSLASLDVGVAGLALYE